VADADATFLTPLPQIDTKEVKEVTKGVKEVDLEEESKGLPAIVPERIPLPEETAGELDEPPSDAVEDPSVLLEAGSKVSCDDVITSPVAGRSSLAPAATERPKASTDDEEKDKKEEAIDSVLDPTKESGGQEVTEKLAK